MELMQINYKLTISPSDNDIKSKTHSSKQKFGKFNFAGTWRWPSCNGIYNHSDCRSTETELAVEAARFLLLSSATLLRCTSIV